MSESYGGTNESSASSSSSSSSSSTHSLILLHVCVFFCIPMAESLLLSSSSSFSSPLRCTRRSRSTSTNAFQLQFCKPNLRYPTVSVSPSLFSLNSDSIPSFILRRRCSLSRLHALESDVPHSQAEEEEGLLTLQQWDSLTAKFSASANVPFLLLQLPQIILNARNLMSGNNSALLAVPWLGMLTGLLGNLALLSYFAKKKEKEAMVVQALGVISTYVILAQLAAAEAMPLPHFIAVSAVVAAGLILNLMNYFDLLSSSIWSFWEDFTTVGGLSVLPQVMWSTFVPYLPSSILPGIISFSIALGLVFMARMGKLSAGGVKFVGALSGWTATLLFMWMPVSQMWTNFLHPDNIKGLSASTMILAMIGNGLMIPRALFIRDLMWFTGSLWATLLYGYANITCLYCFNCISKELYFAATGGLLAWLGIAFWRDSVAYGHGSPLRSLKELVFGPKP